MIEHFIAALAANDPGDRAQAVAEHLVRWAAPYPALHTRYLELSARAAVRHLAGSPAKRVNLAAGVLAWCWAAEVDLAASTATVAQRSAAWSAIIEAADDLLPAPDDELGEALLELRLRSGQGWVFRWFQGNLGHLLGRTLSAGHRVGRWQRGEDAPPSLTEYLNECPYAAGVPLLLAWTCAMQDDPRLLNHLPLLVQFHTELGRAVALSLDARRGGTAPGCDGVSLCLDRLRHFYPHLGEEAVRAEARRQVQAMADCHIAQAEELAGYMQGLEVVTSSLALVDLVAGRTVFTGVLSPL